MRRWIGGKEKNRAEGCLRQAGPALEERKRKMEAE
jgi:hypothetical protein